jgi:hypothetical protein
MVQAILRAYSYVFQFLICAALLALGTVAYLSDTPLKLDFLPWTGKELTNWLFILGITGMIAIFLAVKGVLRFVFLLWTLATAYLTFKGIWSSPYTFSGPTEFYWAVAFFFGVLLTVLGAISRVRQNMTHRR